MGELLLITLGAALVNNLALVELVGAGALIRGPRHVEHMAVLGLLALAVLLVATPLTRLIDRELLGPLELPYLRLLAYVGTIATVTALVAALLRHTAPQWRNTIPTPVLALSSAVLGAALLNGAASRSVTASLFYAAGAGLGFTLALVLFAGLRERLAQADVPLAFRGAPILFVTAGILALAFMAFTGFARL